MAGLKITAQLSGSLRDMLNRRMDELGDGLRSAVENASKSLQAELRDQVRSAGLGNALASAWQVEVYPQKSKRSLHPAGLVYSKATRLHAAFNMGGVITARNAHWLVIPLPAAIELGLASDSRRNKDSSNRAANRKWSNIDAAIDLFGELRFVPIGNGARALLIGDRRTGARNARLAGRQLPRGDAEIPLFLLVRQVSGRKVLDIDGAAQRAMARLRANLSNLLGAA